MLAELNFSAMGTDAHVGVIGPGNAAASALAEGARNRVIALEERWSRFLDTSEVTALNARAGHPMVVSPETLLLVVRAVQGWRLTDGRFDPTVLAALERAGYDRSFDHGLERSEACADDVGLPIGCKGIAFELATRTVRLPEGGAIDPGGIGKGVAADLVVQELLEAGARGACVNLGGDLRAEGEGPRGGGWIIGLRHPFWENVELARLSLKRGAVASTWRTRRAWSTADGRQHHLIDPATGLPAWSGLAGVSVLDGEGWRAEVLAKACFVAGPTEGKSVLHEHGAAGFLVDDCGDLTHVGNVEPFLV